jgi:hypothetical protein
MIMKFISPRMIMVVNCDCTCKNTRAIENYCETTRALTYCSHSYWTCFCVHFVLLVYSPMCLSHAA